jgi:hypothetical protein
MFGFPDTTCNVPAITRGGFRVTGSIGEAAGIGSKGTGVTSPKILRAKALERFSRFEPLRKRLGRKIGFKQNETVHSTR